MLKAFFAPLMAVLKVIKMLGPDVLKLYISMRIYSRILGLEAIPYTKILKSAFSLLKMGAGDLMERIVHLTKSIKFYTLAVASGDGAAAATELLAGSMSKLKGIFAGLFKMLFSWQALVVVAVATLGIAASTTQDWSNITEGLSMGFKELIATLWVGLEPLIMSIQNARDAFGGWLGDVTGMETRMIILRTMQEIGAFIGLFVQLGARLLGFFINIGVEVGQWFVGSLGPGSYWEKFVTFWDHLTDPDTSVDWMTAGIDSVKFIADLAIWVFKGFVAGMVKFTEWLVINPLVFTYDLALGDDGGLSSLFSPSSLVAATGVMGAGGLNDPLAGMGWEFVVAQALAQGTTGAYEQYIGTPSYNMQGAIVGGGEYLYDTGAGVASATTSQAEQSWNNPWNPLNPDNYAIGGQMPRYAGGGPMLVGEGGPEIFIPSTSGRIVANKDLNTMRTRNMLSDWRNRGAGDGGSSAGVMMVGTLVSDNSISKNSKISIDSYAGVV